MGLIDRLDQSEMQELRQLVESFVRAAPAGFTSISRGALRILSPEGFYVGGAASAVVDGLLRVLGRLELTGDFILTGDTTASGNWVQSGSFRLTGPFTVEGTTSMTGNFTSTGEFTLTGPFHINGATDLNGTMTVHPSGKIIIEGPVPLEISNGAIIAGAGRITFVDGLGMVMELAGASVAAGLLGTTISYGDATAGINVLGKFFTTVAAEFAEDVDAAKALTVAGDLTAKKGVNLAFLPTKTGVTSNTWIDPATGDLHQII